MLIVNVVGVLLKIDACVNKDDNNTKFTISNFYINLLYCNTNHKIKQKLSKNKARKIKLLM